MTVLDAFAGLALLKGEPAAPEVQNLIEAGDAVFSPQQCGSPTSPPPATAPDAMAEVRRALWRERISPGSRPALLTPKMTTVLVEALATAA
ncbi:MAG: hypothetical protein ACRDYY_01505 [Acidimicrobiales bacterium]